MDDRLVTLLTDLRSRDVPRETVEEAIKFSAVLPVLDRLGWDWANPHEVRPEYVLGGRKVDFCLQAGTARVFVEVKRPSEDLDQKSHQEQLLDYAFREGVHLAILTNGLRWSFYLPTGVGSWEQRKFFVLDVQAQDPRDAAEHLNSFLSRDAVSDGRAFEAARRVLDATQRKHSIAEAMPIAWKRMASEPDEQLVELLAEATESSCGYRPEDEVVAEFLTRLIAVEGSGRLETATEVVSGTPQRQASRAVGPSIAGSVTGTSPASFQFLGKARPAGTWRDVLIGLAEELYSRHPDDFEKVLSLRGRTRQYFSRDGDSLFQPCALGASGYFAETNLSANDILKRCHELLALFEYPDSDFAVTTRH